MQNNKYKTSEAAAIIHFCLSKKISSKFSGQDIKLILKIKQRWFKKNGLIPKTKPLKGIKLPPVLVDENLLFQYMIEECKQMNLIITPKEIDKILKAESFYGETMKEDNSEEELQAWLN